MSIDLATLVARLSSTAPRCLKSAWPRALQTPSEVLHDSDECLAVSWAVGVLPGNSQCMVIGERRLITENPPTQILLGALAIMHQSDTVEIFDPIYHGYNNEIDVIDEGIVKPAADAQLLSQRRPFECEQCTAKLFSVTVKVYYQHGTVDTLLKYPELPSSDLFNAFNVYGVCANCQRHNIIAEYDGL